jgi:hypothetical protein
MTAEASYSKRQDARGWQDNQRIVSDAVRAGSGQPVLYRA